MSKSRPDFTDIVYADARARDAAKKGLALAEAKDRKGAQAAYREALKWSKESERLEKLVRPSSPARRTSARVPKKR